MVIFFSSA